MHILCIHAGAHAGTHASRHARTNTPNTHPTQMVRHPAIGEENSPYLLFVSGKGASNGKMSWCVTSVNTFLQYQLTGTAQQTYCFQCTQMFAMILMCLVAGCSVQQGSDTKAQAMESAKQNSIPSSYLYAFVLNNPFQVSALLFWLLNDLSPCLWHFFESKSNVVVPTHSRALGLRVRLSGASFHAHLLTCSPAHLVGACKTGWQN